MILDTNARRSLGDVIKDCASARDIKVLKESVSQYCEYLGVPQFAIVSANRIACCSIRLAIHSYHPTWTDYYLREKYDRIDPVLIKATTERVPFFWGDEESLADMSGAQRTLFDQARNFGIRAGVTMPLFDRIGHSATMTFSSDLPEPEFRRSVEEKIPAMCLVAYHVDTALRALLEDDAGECAPKGLTQREQDCLAYSAQGMTLEEISRQIGLSRRTVVYHVENARKKLQARSLTQAVAKAVREGLISF